MSITTIDGIVAGLSSSQNFNFMIPSATNVAGGYVNLQRAVTTSFGQMAVPALNTAGGTLHVDTQLGFPNGTEPVEGLFSYLAKMNMISSVAGSIMLYDRVWSCTGFSGIVTTAQTVTSFPVLTRPDANGTGLEIWIECYTALGATASNITVQYTNSDGVSGRNTIATAIPTSLPANRMFAVPLQSGDNGVKSIQSVTLSVSTGTAGAFGVTLMKRITSSFFPIANIGVNYDFADLGMPKIQDYSALNFIHQATTTTSGVILGQMNVIQG